MNTLKSNLTFFQKLDSGILRSLCGKEKGSFYKNFSDRLENMLKYDEYAGVPEISGLVYGANCPLYIYNESNRNDVCGMKYGDDRFLNVEPIRLLYSLDTHDSPWHYDLLVSQHTITASHAITDTAISPLSIFDTGETYVDYHVVAMSQILILSSMTEMTTILFLVLIR